MFESRNLNTLCLYLPTEITKKETPWNTFLYCLTKFTKLSSNKVVEFPVPASLQKPAKRLKMESRNHTQTMKPNWSRRTYLLSPVELCKRTSIFRVKQTSYTATNLTVFRTWTIE